MLTPMRPSLLAVLIVLVVACGGSGGNGVASDAPGSSGSPGGSGDAPSGTPDFGAVDHASGPTDIVLRFEEGGGFVMPAFRATEVPIFTLYGDGTIVFRNPRADPLEPVGSWFPQRPFRTAKLTEEQIQDLLAYALGEGGLGIARPNYPNDLISDAPTAVFTVNAGGLNKTVSIYALGLELDGVPDAPARAAFARLAERLGNIDDGGAFATADYTPERYRGVLLEGQPGDPNARPWPWTDIAPTDFASNGDPNAFQIPARVMSVDEVRALAVDPYAGGFQGLTLIGPGDGRLYSFSLRPLLPGETE